MREEEQLYTTCLHTDISHFTKWNSIQSKHCNPNQSSTQIHTIIDDGASSVSI